MVELPLCPDRRHPLFDALPQATSSVGPRGSHALGASGSYQTDYFAPHR